MREKRDEILILRITKTEKNRIYEKMYGMGIRSLSAYIRKMALDGYCLNLDLPQLRRMSYLLQNCSNNLNQVAKRVNSQLRKDPRCVRRLSQGRIQQKVSGSTPGRDRTAQGCESRL